MRYRSIALLSLLIVDLGVSQAAIVTNWERHYRPDSRNETFANTVMDAAGSVYAVGSTFNGADEDALVVKYGVGGSVHWAIRFTGAGNQSGKAIAFSADLTQLYVSYDRPDGVGLARINPASGAVLWNKPDLFGAQYTLNRDFMFVQNDAPNKHILAPFRAKENTSNSVAAYSYWDTGAGFGGVTNPMGSLSETILDLAPRPQGGAYVLIGEPTGSGGPVNTIFVIDLEGHVGPTLQVPKATCLASTPANGGILYAVGDDGSNGLRIVKYDTATNSQSGIVDNILSGATNVHVDDAETDPQGRLYVAGYEYVGSFEYEWLLARYETNLTRRWRTSRPSTTASEEFHKVAVEPSGSVAVNARKTGTFQTWSTRVYDGDNGLYLGDHGVTTGDGLTRLYGLAANPDGRFAAVGVLDSMDIFGLAWLLEQDGFKRVSVPLNSYVGGSSITASLSTYGVRGASRVVDLSSSSTYATVPSTVTIPANVSSKTFTIATARTSVDRTVDIAAFADGVWRHCTFYVLAPRPSALTMTPDVVTGGTSSTGKVNLTGLAPTGGQSVSLTSNKAQVTVPANINVPAGAGSQTFVANTTPVGATVVATISATAHGATKTKTLTVNP